MTNVNPYLSEIVDSRDIAPIMGRLWSPLAAVTSRWREEVNAQIAVAITAASIVPDRPRVLVQIYKTNYSHGLITRSGLFALNFLTRDQLFLIKELGLVSGADRGKLADVPYCTGVTGVPILDGCMGHLECRVVNAMDGGDMTCFLANVVAGKAHPERTPISWREARRIIPREWNEEWEAKIGAEIELSRWAMDGIDYSPWTGGKSEN